MKNNRLKFKTLEKLPINLEKNLRIYLKLIKKNQKITTCNQLDLETLGSWPIMPKNLFGHRMNDCLQWVLMHRKTSLPHDGYLFSYMPISSLHVPPMPRRAYGRAFKVS